MPFHAPLCRSNLPSTVGHPDIWSFEWLGVVVKCTFLKFEIDLPSPLVLPTRIAPDGAPIYTPAVLLNKLAESLPAALDHLQTTISVLTRKGRYHGDVWDNGSSRVQWWEAGRGLRQAGALRKITMVILCRNHDRQPAAVWDEYVVKSITAGMTVGGTPYTFSTYTYSTLYAHIHLILLLSLGKIAIVLPEKQPNPKISTLDSRGQALVIKRA